MKRSVNRLRSMILFPNIATFTTDFTLDRNREEPHPQSTMALEGLIFSAIWLMCGGGKKQGIKQFTWIKVTDTWIIAARFDRFSNHYLVTKDIIPSNIKKNWD